MFAKYLRSELFRISKMYSTYVLIGVLFVCTLLSTFMTTNIDYASVMGVSDEELATLNEEGHSIVAVQEATEAGVQSDANIDQVEVDYETVNIFGHNMYYDCDLTELFQQSVMGQFHILYLSIFTGLFFGAIYRTGYDKNLLISNISRLTLMGARMTVLAIYNAVMLLTVFISTVFSDLICTKEITVDMSPKFFLYVLTSFLLSFAFTTVVATITISTRSTAAGITSGVIMAFGIVVYLIILLSKLMIAFLGAPEDFDLADYMISQTITKLTIDADGMEYTRAIICSLVYIAVSLVSTGALVRKRDVT